MFKSMVVAAFGVATALTSSWCLAQQGPFRINVPETHNAPRIDGQIEAGEWDAASSAPVALAGKGLVVDGARFRLLKQENTMYFLFVAEEMTVMPRSTAQRRDQAVWQDDAVELILTRGARQVHLLVNAEGVLADLRDGDLSWNSPSIKVATSKIGTDFAVGGDVKRGFVVELCIALEDVGVPLPQPGEMWGVQVAFDRVGENPYTTWTPRGRDLNSVMGELAWGGGANQLDLPRFDEAKRQPVLTGVVGETSCVVFAAAGASPEVVEVPKGPLSWSRDVAAGTQYTIKLDSPHYRYAVEAEAEALVPFVAVSSPSQESFYLALDPTEVPATLGPVLRLRVLHEGQVKWEQVLNTRESHEPWEAFVSFAGWSLGPVEVRLEEVASDGTENEIAIRQLRVPPKPAWASYELPELPVVPDIFPSVEATPTEGKVWGRTHRFGRSIFLDQVTSQDQPMLSGPIELRGMVDGRPIRWRIRSHELISRAEDQAIYHTLAATEGLTAKVTTRLEFDGYLRFDFELDPGDRPRRLTDLRLVVPVRREVAQLYAEWIKGGFSFNDTSTWNHAGRLEEGGRATRFTNFFWLGHHDLGLQWFTENNEGWQIADPDKAIEARVAGDTVNLIAHLSDGDRQIDKPLPLMFGIMAGPIRPRPSPDDMSGNRIIVLTSMNQLEARYPELPQVVIPSAAGDWKTRGCYELDLRPDWNPEAPAADQQVIPLWNKLNSAGNQLRLDWVAGGRLRVTHLTPQLGSQVLGEAPIALKQGKWYRLAFNYAFGKTIEVYLDGEPVFSAPLVGPAPAWDRFTQRLIGGGPMAVRGWRISAEHRAAPSLVPGQALVADPQTLILDTITGDPTRLRMTNPEVGYLTSPGYLSGNWTYDADADCLVAGQVVPEQSALEHYRDIGINGVVIFDWSQYFTGAGEPRDAAQMQRVMQQAKQMGIRVLPYTSNGLADVDPAYPDYKYEISGNPPNIDPQPYWRDGTISQMSGPPVEGMARWQHNLQMIDRLMQMGAGGVYLDGQAYPQGTANPMHRLPIPDGARSEKLAGYDMGTNINLDLSRKYLWTMYKLIRVRYPDAIFDAHNSLGWTLPTMGMVTDVTNGESLGLYSNWQEVMTPSWVAAEFTGRAFGFNAESLFYANVPVPVEYGMAIMGIHGSSPRCMWGMWPERAEALWKLVDDFGTTEAQFLRYDDPDQKVIASANPAVLASTFVHPEGRALVLLVNWNSEPVETEMRINPAAIGIPARMQILCANNNAKIPHNAGRFTMTLRPYQLTYLLLSDPVQGKIGPDAP